MKIQFLGTGAADWPLKKPDGAAEFRRLSAALIDGTLLIDCGPQLPDALREYGIDVRGVKYVLNTHTHRDHYSPETLSFLTDAGAAFVPMRAGESRQLGEYTVFAYAANHGTCADAVHYIIKDASCAIFYGLDGAWLLYDEVQGIRTHKPALAVLDATVGFVDGDYRVFEHNNLAMVLEMRKSLSPYVKQFCISHMARTLHTDHAALAARMRESDILVAHDGMELEIS